MAAPLVRIIADKAGRYRRAGKFVSAAAYRAQQWRLRGGKAGTASRTAWKARAEQGLRAELGAPPAGKQWVQIASKYPERFEDYLDELGIRIR